VSGQGMTPFVRVKGVTGDAEGLVDVKAFEQDPESALGELDRVDVPDLDTDVVLGQADWDEPDDEAAVPA
jgi:hypothetical protein